MDQSITALFGTISLVEILVLLMLGFVFAVVWIGVNIVPQSEVYLVERFGKYTRTLSPGLNLIVPFLDRVAQRISILERALPEFRISVITKDNVEVALEATVFYRLVDAAASVYRIHDIDSALHTAATSIVRSAAGKLELDELQSSREKMNQEIANNLSVAAEQWGMQVTRTEITDIIIDEMTKEAQRQQLNAERQRRALIAKSEGEKRSIELNADAEFYQAQKLADAKRVAADAEAYAVRVQAEAEAEQTRVIAEAIAANGQPAIDFEIVKKQVEALAQVASSNSTKTMILPTNVTAMLGSLDVITEALNLQKKSR